MPAGTVSLEIFTSESLFERIGRDTDPSTLKPTLADVSVFLSV